MPLVRSLEQNNMPMCHRVFISCWSSLGAILSLHQSCRIPDDSELPNVHFPQVPKKFERPNGEFGSVCRTALNGLLFLVASLGLYASPASCRANQCHADATQRAARIGRALIKAQIY